MSSLRRPTSHPTANDALELFFAIPADLSAGMDDEHCHSEISRMFAHSRLTQQFVDGQISPSDYADGLASLGHDPNQLADMWEQGKMIG